MGLLKDLQGSRIGTTASYHHIISFSMNKGRGGKGEIVVAGYVDKAARDEAIAAGDLGKGVILTNRFRISGDEFAELYTRHLQNGELVPDLLYEYITGIEDGVFADATTDHTEF